MRRNYASMSEQEKENRKNEIVKNYKKVFSAKTEEEKEEFVTKKIK